MRRVFTPIIIFKKVARVLRTKRDVAWLCVVVREDDGRGRRGEERRERRNTQANSSMFHLACTT
jgi:hypothetical protein